MQLSLGKLQLCVPFPGLFLTHDTAEYRMYLCMTVEASSYTRAIPKVSGLPPYLCIQV